MTQLPWWKIRRELSRFGRSLSGQSVDLFRKLYFRR